MPLYKHNGKIRLNATGCGLIDQIYTAVDYSSERIQKYFSKKDGDGGLVPGKLVFSEDLELFAGKDIQNILGEVVGNSPVTTNIGGPALVAMIHVSQLLSGQDVQINYYGISGNDKDGSELQYLLGKTGLDLSGIIRRNGKTPSTFVLSDPAFHEGQGERMFINTLGLASSFLPYDLPGDFYDADILFLGGTALVPGLHDDLHYMLEQAVKKECLTILSTVYDFRNEFLNPGGRWPIGKGRESFTLIDLLIMDKEEACKISGKGRVEDAVSWFAESGVHAFIITNGPGDIISWSDGKVFRERGEFRWPALDFQTYREKDRICDTTGCGDNFTGGILFSICEQMAGEMNTVLSLSNACKWGIVSGTLAGLVAGGVQYESAPGEKRLKLEKLYYDYCNLNS